MVSRVASALSKHIKPITSTKGADSKVGKDNPKARQRKHAGSEEAEEKEEDLSPDFEETGQAALSDQPEEASNNGPSKASGEEKNGKATVENEAVKQSSVAGAFLEICAKLQSQNQALLRWVALHTYQGSLRNQRKIEKVKKGSMLDETVD